MANSSQHPLQRHPAEFSAAGTAAIVIVGVFKIKRWRNRRAKIIGAISIAARRVSIFLFRLEALSLAPASFHGDFIEWWPTLASAVPIFCNSLWAMTQFPFDQAKSLLTNWSID